MHGLTSRSLSLIAELKMAMLIGDGFRAGQASSVAAGSPSHATLGSIVGGASRREIRVSSPIIE